MLILVWLLATGLIAKMASAAEAGMAPDEAAATPQVGAAPSAIKLSGHRQNDASSLLLTLAEPASMAIFVRGSVLWVVVAGGNKNLVIDQPSIAAALRSYIAGARRIPNVGATIVAFDLHAQQTVDLTRTERSASISFVSKGAADAPQSALDFSDNRLSLANVDDVVEFEDPLVGDRLIVGLMDASSSEPVAGATTTDLRILSSLAGVALSVRSDQVQATVSNGEMTVSRHLGLRVSPAPVPIEHIESIEKEVTAAFQNVGSGDNVQQPFRQDPTPASLAASETDVNSSSGENRSNFGFAAFQDIAELPLPDALRQIGYDQRRTDPGNRIAYFLDAARWNLVNGFFQEAAAYLELAEVTLSQLESMEERTDDEVIDLLHNIKRVVQDPAYSFLPSDGSLDKDAEYPLWKTISNIRRDPSHFDRQEIAAAREVLLRYPLSLRLMFAIELADAFLKQGRADPALVLLDEFAAFSLSDKQRARILAVEARAWIAEGDIARGLNKFDQAISLLMPVERYILLAERLEVATRHGFMEAKPAADLHASYRPFWRGLPDEPQLLKALGRLQERAGRPVQALEAWRTAIERGERPVNDTLQLMRRLFDNVALSRGWQRTPFEALEMMRKFRELIPPGEAGDRMIAGLAREYAEMGLPEVGAAMLSRIRYSTVTDIRDIEERYRADYTSEIDQTHDSISYETFADSQSAKPISNTKSAQDNLNKIIEKYRNYIHNFDLNFDNNSILPTDTIGTESASVVRPDVDREYEIKLQIDLLESELGGHAYFIDQVHRG